MFDRFVLVEWVDSQAGTGWRGIEDAAREDEHNIAASCFTAGFLVRSTDDALTVALSCAPNNKPEPLIGDTITIPRVSIRHTWRLSKTRRA